MVNMVNINIWIYGYVYIYIYMWIYDINMLIYRIYGYMVNRYG